MNQLALSIFTIVFRSTVTAIALAALLQSSFEFPTKLLIFSAFAWFIYAYIVVSVASAHIAEVIRIFVGYAAATDRTARVQSFQLSALGNALGAKLEHEARIELMSPPEPNSDLSDNVPLLFALYAVPTAFLTVSLLLLWPHLTSIGMQITK